MLITNHPYSFNTLFIEPFYQGIDNIKASFSGKKVEQISLQTIGNTIARRENDLSLLERISAFVVGTILLIPIINAVAFAILQAVNSSLVFQRQSATQPEPPTIAEIYLQRKNEGFALTPEAAAVEEAPASVAEYEQRKNEALLELPQYPAEGHLNFECSHQVVQYDLDAILEKFNGTHDPARLLELYEYAQGDNENKRELRRCLNMYTEPVNDRERVVRTLLSKLFDFFQTNKNLFAAGSEQEALFKAQILDVFAKIIDAHTNCIDQVLGQTETIVADVIADFESVRGEGVQTIRDRLISRAAFALFKYRANLIRHICVTEYPGERHMADMERAVKQRIAEMMGMQGAIFNVGAQYDGMIANIDQKVENIVNIFLTGQALQGDANDVIIRRRQEAKYSPEKYLIDALKTYFGVARTLRNDLLIWTTRHFNLGEATPLTVNFVKALSDELSFEDGGNLKNQGLLFLLEKTGIFINNALAQAAV